MGRHPMLRFKDVCKHDMKLTDIDSNSWELLANDHGHWHCVVPEGSQKGRGEEEPTVEKQTTIKETEAAEPEPDLLVVIRFCVQHLWQRLSG